MGIKVILLYISLVVLVLFNGLWFFRIFAEKQVDDISPFIDCSQEIIDKSETLMVIPLFEGKSIAENKSWCKNILSLNKTLGMHGVYHIYKEFKHPKDENYVKEGMEEFKKCFGFYPQVFEAPQLSLSYENEKILKSLELKIQGYPYTITHKVYHCSDTGKYSNEFIDFA